MGLPFPKLPKTTFERQGQERDNTEWVITIDDLGGKVEADHDAIPVAFPELQFRTAVTFSIINSKWQVWSANVRNICLLHRV